MGKIYVFKLGIIFALIILWSGTAFSGTVDEVREKTTEVKKLVRTKPTHRLDMQAGVFAGYDSNPKLSLNRKGDSYQEFLFSLEFAKKLMRDTRFTFNYDLDALNYSEFTNVSNILNHLRFGIHQDVLPFTLGTGIDLGVLYYPKNDNGNFVFPKGFVYARQNIAKNLYHKVQFEYGVKDYLSQKALGDSISTYQDKKRFDRRTTAEYSINSSLFNQRLFLKLKALFSINNSNARYVDFYDYKSYEVSPSIDYALFKNLHLITNFYYIRKNYDSRTVTFGDYKEKDNLYVATTGIRYDISKNNSLSLYYTYRDNSSNDDIAEYTENVINCGWQYRF